MGLQGFAAVAMAMPTLGANVGIVNRPAAVATIPASHIVRGFCGEFANRPSEKEISERRCNVGGS